jgi:YYY domain-containing protein
VLVAALIKLTGVLPAVAYNLAVPTFYAMTAVGGFSAALSLALLARRSLRRVVPGLLAVLFIALLGNLGQVQVLWQDIQGRSSVQFDTRVPGLLAVTKTLDGLSEVAAKGLVTADHREKWYWNASRVIPHPPTEPGPINEFPLFTFLVADLHAHLMALPFTLLVLAFAISLVRAGSLRQWPRDGPAGAGVVTHLREVVWRTIAWHEVLTLAALGLAVGALWTLNTWDWPTYTAVVALALACREYARRGPLNLGMIGAVTWRWAFVLTLGYVLFLPFHQHYAASYGGFTWWEGSRTPLSAYVTMHGLFLFLIGTYLALELAYGRGHNALVRLLRAPVRNLIHLRRYRRLHGRLVRTSSGYTFALRIGAFMLVAALILFAIGYGVPSLIILLLALAVLLGLSPRPAPRRQFILGLIALGLALTLVPEIIVLDGDIGRMNTVFKFYLQVWIIWSVAAAAIFPWTVASLYRWGKLRWFWWPAFALLLVACLFYPLMAIPARVDDHFATSTGRTLDGTAYMQTALYRDRDQDIALDWDRQAMAWLQDHVHGSPVIVEANTPLYRWGNRVAVNTGLPALIGWDWHQRQQRTVLPPDVVDRRLRDVQTIYTDQDPKLVSDLLHGYGVQYVYVGALERLYYDAAGLAKFDAANGLYWNVIYENPGVQIYQVLYDAPS